MRTLMFFVSGLAGAMPMAVTAQTAPSVDAVPEKKICRTVTPPTGSIMPPKRVCRTAADWAKIGQPIDTTTDRFLSDRERQGRMMRPAGQ